MIYIDLTDDLFGYDIRSLVKEFFPFEEITCNLPEEYSMGIKLLVDSFAEGSELKPEEVTGFDIYVTANDEEPEHLRIEGKYSTKLELKNDIKRNLYSILKLKSGRDLPWGTLTGIRPVSLIYNLKEEGLGNLEISERIKKEYLISQEKSVLGIAIANKEKALLDEFDYKSGYSLYIGIPFCPSTCLYCSFTSYSIEKYKELVNDYLDALIKELKFVFANVKRLPDTIYMGGGTPTSISAEQMDRLLGELSALVDFGKVREITVEAGRPDSITKDKLMVLKKYGISRISVNPQTMNQKTLDLIGRKHSVDQVREAFEMARELGFDDINMDLILGLPEETAEDVKYTLDEIVKMNPESVTIHALALKRASRLNTMDASYRQKKVKLSNEMTKLSAEAMFNNEYKPYYLYRQKNMAGNQENIGYAKVGKECLYNILTMEEKQRIIACGAGASSKIVYYDGRKTEHIFNVKDVREYITRIDEMMERKAEFGGMLWR